jgi:nucleoid-associated protein YgaU
VPLVRRLVARSLGLGLTASIAVTTGPIVSGPAIAEPPPTTAGPRHDTRSPVESPSPGELVPSEEPETMVLVDESEPAAEHRSPTATQRLLRDDEPDTSERPVTSPDTTSTSPTAIGPATPPPSSAPTGPGSTGTSTDDPQFAPDATPHPQTPPEPHTETWTIAPGDHLWAVATATLADERGRSPGDGEIADYLAQLIEANRSRLADPNNPDLVYPGQVMQLPPVPVS